MEHLVGQTLHGDQVSELLGVSPVLPVGSRASWVRYDRERQAGINATLTIRAPGEGDPYDVSLSVYEQVPSGNGEAGESVLVVALEFERVARNSAQLRVVEADGVHNDEIETVVEALRLAARVLDGWPMEREML